ncbi:MAG: hypothetical protein EP298_12700 [Gammaproteobacteria bacterium]|nr:MAG: hypothetical protein EP298_12700 [Gammaproteobacteria bacterium]UTW41684.1 hypothetical protein KFE69_09220 [bacterium SCSIO 12844]
MKLVISILTLGLCNISVLYASADYKFKISNHMPYSITISKSYEKCLYDVDDLPMTIAANSDKTFKFEDKNKFATNCYNGTKKLDLDGTVDVNGQTQKITIKWRHTKDSSWYTTISGESNVLALTKATCDGNNCLDTKSKGNGDMDLYAEINIKPGAEDQFIPVSLKLGDIKVMDGYGKVVPTEEVTGRVTLDYTKKYIISFSKTTKECKVLQGIVSCPSSIGFTRQDENLIFSCKQTESNDTACPWVTKEGSNSSFYVNPYG